MYHKGRQAHAESSSILPLSVNFGRKEKSQSMGAEDEGADLTDDISVDITTSAE